MTDRPWGLTLGAIALRGHTGQLTVDSDGKRYSIAFDRGAIVAASSPAAADAIARVALTSHFITSTQVPDITRRLAQAPDRDEVEVVSEMSRFTPDQVLRLRHRLVAQRAARTFSLERGDFVLADRIALPVFPGVSVDHRHVVYLGVRNLSEQRLLADLRQLGSYFVLKPEASDDLPRFGFEPSAHPVLEALRLGTSLPELEASHREIDPRLAQAVIYALVSCGACTILPRAAPPPTPSGATPLPPLRNVTARASLRSGRPGTGDEPAGDAASQPASPGSPPPPSGGRTSPPFAPRTGSTSTVDSGAGSQDSGTNTPAATRPRTPSDPRTPRPATPTPAPFAPPAARAPAPAVAAPAPAAIQTLPPARSTARPPTSPPLPVAARADTQDSGKLSAIPTATRAAGSSPTSQPAVPRAVTPTDAELRGFSDQRTPSGFGDQRTPQDQRTPTDPSKPRTPTGSPLSSRASPESAAAAEEAFRRGELAMKRDQPGEAILEFKAACDLDPQEVDYTGMLVWAKFCAAGDKAAIGAETRKALERVAQKSNRPERARFYLGRVERMLGRDREALRHFQEVLDHKPNHADAASEIRAIEARLQAATGKPGLFGRKR